MPALLAVVLALLVVVVVVGLASLVLVVAERFAELITDGVEAVTLAFDCFLVVTVVVAVVSLATTVTGLLVVVVAVIPPGGIAPVSALTTELTLVEFNFVPEAVVVVFVAGFEATASND